MNRLAIFLAILMFSFGLSATDNKKRPLDLPSGGDGLSEDEEDSPEVISFYSNLYEGECFVWCLDKSGSMNGIKMETLKAEVTNSISQLSDSAHFSLVAFSNNIISFSEIPLPAVIGNKAGASQWVQELIASNITCAGLGGVRALNIAYRSPKENKTVLFVSDGVPTCNGSDSAELALEVITLANYQAIPIHTLYITSNGVGSAIAIQFMQDLAAANSGTYQQIN